MTTKDYFSLLRPFDADLARAGEQICWWDDGEIPEEVKVFNNGAIAVVWADSTYCGEVNSWTKDEAVNKFRMSPLGRIEGKPVYKGDELYWPDWKDAKPRTITGVVESASEPVLTLFEIDHSIQVWSDHLSWNPPKKEITVDMVGFRDSFGKYVTVMRDAAEIEKLQAQGPITRVCELDFQKVIMVPYEKQ